jgi:transcriptional regulator with XRE-family HTH domain
MPSIYSKGYQRFLKRLKKARVHARLTQVQVGKRLKMPQTWVSKVERGERRLDIVEVARFAKLYKKPLSYFG